MERQPVDSSLIRSVGYDLLNSILEIELVESNRIRTSGRVLRYNELGWKPNQGSFSTNLSRICTPIRRREQALAVAAARPESLAGSDHPP